MDHAYKMFYKRLSELQSIILENLANCETSLVTDNVSEKKRVITKLFSNVSELYKLCNTDSPEWLVSLVSICNKLLSSLSNTQNRKELLEFIVLNRDNIKQHDWFDTGTNEDLNFETMYKKYKNESKVPELFDKMVQTIDNAFRNESLNLNNTEKPLKKLLSVIRTNMNKSFCSDEIIVSASVFLLKELSACSGDSAPEVKSMLNVLFTSAIEIYDTVSEIRKKIEQEIGGKLKSGSPQFAVLSGRDTLIKTGEESGLVFENRR
ncbi:hypothetical protein K7I13_02045 [Brucepastera parasyntrophica]|uniref:hypothetical protein n=1 Tax=Brucepastera parasyntrophica TaxID=2880008 RepID=UPI00210DF381|nr:hypothetical protein [Brucepastera parasyntrophica]ULQ60128.1 hypothetical protein K7I13_02045 [Brucepastera parasyntrophica]